jgi:hypothetical protein
MTKKFTHLIGAIDGQLATSNWRWRQRSAMAMAMAMAVAICGGDSDLQW